MKLIDRIQVFKNQKNISSLIKEFQQSFFDEEFDTVDDEMFDAISLKNEKLNYSGFSIMLNHSEINSYPKVLSEKITEVLKFLKTEKLILISHLKLDFFGNLKHDYLKVINAYSELSKITNSKTYKEAIESEISEIESLFEIFFWLERCDSSIPEYVFWTDSKERFCFYFCKYGNIHFVDFTNGNLINEKELEKLNFIVNEDYDQFSEDGIIENRQVNTKDFK
ncbi:MAG: hypothetical protein EAZ75_10225 [Flavobacteriia bacterium]|jgi:hypothetical protein|uniref:hypothetical protein n=1 Tax=Flavobacterium sp. TaxID=239 RepID=UPI0029732717|nr:MAG: hypothetical protein EAZ75_10225 [Flavobacteriia bacterium]